MPCSQLNFLDTINRKKFFNFCNKVKLSVNFICDVSANLRNKPIFNFETIAVIVSKGFSRWGQNQAWHY